MKTKENENAQGMDACPVCGEKNSVYLFILRGEKISHCPGCGLVTSKSLQIPGSTHVFQATDERELNFQSAPAESETEIEANYHYAEILKRNGLAAGSKVLLCTEPEHAFLEIGRQNGWQIIQPTNPDLADLSVQKEFFDAVVIPYFLEKQLDPVAFLSKIHAFLKPNALVLITVPSLESASAQFFKNAWTEWRPENHLYFDHTTIQLLLWKMGFSSVHISKDKRIYTLDHINERAKAFPRSWITKLIQIFYALTPIFLRKTHLRLPTSGIIVTARRAEIHEPQTCSFILPAYNEQATFKVLMEVLLAKQMPFGLQKEIVIVESNSQDGTRQQVMEYQNHPDVKIILQEKAFGKGNAVREGFKHASGDILLIQDADLEYDLNDIDLLLEPIAYYQIPFVLGARHGGRVKMRQFNNQQGLSTLLNFGHVFFTALLNLLYGQRLKDPFTMYKVFRRDCLDGLKFECNRFDFDHELVAKFARKGYSALEIPINYRSRSFKEGKKIRVFRDPFTWIWALIKFRFVNIYQNDEKNG